MMNTQELHVIFGSGPVGCALLDELRARNKRIRLVNRRGVAPPHVDVTDVEVVPGDATNPATTHVLCRDAAVVYQCASPPGYRMWEKMFPSLQRSILEGAAAHGAKLVVMENLYMYGPHGGAPMTETMPFNARGKCGRVRAHLAQELMEAHERGIVRAVSGRASDFFGPRVFNSVMGEQVFRAALRGKPAPALLNIDIPHTYTYMPDIGKALVLLGERDEALGQAWHLPNPSTLTTREFLTMVYQKSGHPLKLMATPKLMMRALELFIPRLRGFSENFYQFEEPFIVDQSKFVAAFGDLATPLPRAIEETVAWYRQHP